MTPLPPRGATDVLYVIDLSNLVDKHFHTPFSTNAAGNAVEALEKMFALRAPAFAVAAADNAFPTFRDELLAEGKYKAGREKSAAERAAKLEQRRLAEELCVERLGLKVVKVRGFEADDVVATFVEMAAAEGVGVVVVTNDKDMGQLVRGRHVVLWDGKGAAVGPPEVVAKFSVRPEQMADYLALAGDKTDRIPGVYGIGPAGAVKLLERFATLEEACEGAEAMARGSTLGHVLFVEDPLLWRRLLDGHRSGQAAVMKKLTTLRRDVPVRVASLEELRLPE